MASLRELNSALSHVFRIDLALDKRSLALFRIFVALTVIGDLLNRFVRDYAVFYTDSGLLSGPDMKKILWNECYLPSAYVDASGSPTGLAFVVFLHVLAAFLLLFGLFTKVMTCAVWYFTIALHARSSLIGHGGDTYLRAVLFWAMFLPLGDFWSLDSMIAKASNASTIVSTRVKHLGTAAYTLQVVVMYIISVFMKWGPAWRFAGEEALSATYYALGLDPFRTVLGDAFRDFLSLDVLRLITGAVIIFEFVGALMLLSSHVHIRLLALIGFFGLHAAFGFMLRIGMFSPLCIVALLPLIPSDVWSTVEAVFGNGAQPAVRTMKLVTDKDVRKKTTTNKTGAAITFTSDGIARMDGESVYQFVKIFMFVIGQVLVGFFFVAMLLDNIKQLTTVREQVWDVLPQPLLCLNQASRLDQSWSMFSPNPPKATMWFRFEGRLQKVGQYSTEGADSDLIQKDAKLPPVVDFLRNGGMFKHFETAVAQTTNPPTDVYLDFGSHRFFKYWENIGMHASRAEMRAALVRYVCRQWNHRHLRKLEHLDIFYEQFHNHLNGTRSRADTLALHSEDCPAELMNLGAHLRAGAISSDDNPDASAATPVVSTEAPHAPDEL